MRTSYCFAVAFCVISACAGAGPAGAQSLDSIRQAFESQSKPVEDAHVTRMVAVRERYTAKLNALKMQLRKPEEKRSLDYELARFDREQSVPTEAPKELDRKIVAAQVEYARTAVRWEGQRDAQLKPLARNYDRQLRELLRVEEAAGNAESVKGIREALADHGPLMYRLGMADERIPVLILINQHNAQYGDRGTRMVTVSLFKGPERVWERAGILVEWSATRDPATAVVLPETPFDRLRVTVTEREGVSAGFSEIKVMLRGKNVAPNGRVSVSAMHKHSAVERLVDGIETSRDVGKGYFTFPDKSNGWVELDLIAVLPQAPALRQAPKPPAAAAGGGRAVILEDE